MSTQLPSDEGSPATTPSDSDPKVHGIDITVLTQCAHWHSERDIIAIKHKCCGNYYACVTCHEALAGHPPDVWPRAQQRDTKAILCGRCRRELTIQEYLGSRNVCPGCSAAFNPGCALHYGLYFEV